MTEHTYAFIWYCNIRFVRFACLILLVDMMDYCGYVYAAVGLDRWNNEGSGDRFWD
jgi:hypothetical protein